VTLRSIFASCSTDFASRFIPLFFPPFIPPAGGFPPFPGLQAGQSIAPPQAGTLIQIVPWDTNPITPTLSSNIATTAPLARLANHRHATSGDNPCPKKRSSSPSTKKTDQARQHKLFRQTITTLVAGVTGAVIGLSLKDANTIINSPLLTIAGTFLAIIGTYGLIACAKHYERNRMHVERLREIRHRLDTLPGITPAILTTINTNADFRHNLHYPRLYRLQLNKVWNTFHVLVILLGITLAILPSRDTLRTIITQHHVPTTSTRHATH
jgi:hypothetical protein